MKKILITFLVLILTAIIGGVTYIFTFDLNSYKVQIEKAILEKTGIPVSINGQMQFSKSLNPTLVIQDMEIKNPSGFPDTSFMTVKKTELSFDLVAFFKNIINVQNIELSDVTMQLQVNRKGQKNWIDLLQSKSAAGDKKANKPALSKAAALSPIAKMQIDLISLNNLNILYQDDKNNVKDKIIFSSLTLKGLVNVDASVLYNGEKFVFSGSVKNLISVLTTRRNLNFSFDIKALKGTAKVSGVCRDVLNCAEDVTLNISATGSDLQKMYAFGGGKIKEIPAHPFKLKAAGRLLKKQLLLDGSLDLADDGIQASYNVEYDFRKSVGKGRVDLDVTKSDFIQKYGLQPFSLQTSYVLQADGLLIFDNLTAMFDETDLDGSLSVLYDSQKPVLKGNLHSHYFKFSNVFFDNAVGSSEKSGNKKAKGKIFSDSQINLNWLDKSNIQLSLAVDNWSANNLFARYPVILADIMIQDSKMRINLKEGTSFAGGQLVGKLDLDKTTALPVWNLEMVAENLNFNQISALRKQLHSGSMDVNLFLTAKGDNEADIFRSLDGKALFLTSQVEILSPIITALFSPTAQGGASYRTAQDLFVKCGVINASVKNGDVVLDKKAAIETSRFNMLVDGDINLNKETINIRFIPQKTTARFGEVTQVISAVSLTGKLDNPKPGIEADVSSLLADVLPKQPEKKSADKKSVLDVYKKKTTEDFSVCRIAAEGMQMKTIDLYMGRLPKTEEVEKVVEVAPKQVQPTKAEQLGKQLLDSLSDVLKGSVPSTEISNQKKTSP